MAGAGFKTFNTGDVLTASDVNTYLMQQTTMVFADASARSTALGANVAEGMISYLKDTNAVERYDGSSWGAIGAGDIEGVTAGAGLSGGGTSGTVTLSLNSQAAGRNAIINGGFDIWQRGTSFSVSSGWIYTADRWQCTEGAGTWTLARESTVVPSGSQYSLKLTSGGTTTGQIATLIETANVTALQGQTVTISAKVAASASIPMQILLYYSTTADDNITNTGTAISASSGGTATPTSTTFVNLTGTYAIPSNAKTLQVRIASQGNMTSGQIFYVGQVQLELGSSATPFSRAGGTIQGELAACQRYYQRKVATSSNTYATYGNAIAVSTTAYWWQVQLPVEMRIVPTSIDYSTIRIQNINTGYPDTLGLTLSASNSSASVVAGSGGVASGLTSGNYYVFGANGSASAYIGFSAEL